MVPTTETARGYAKEITKTVEGKAVQLVCQGCLGNENTCGMCKLNQFLRTLELFREGVPMDAAAERAKDEADKCLRITNEKYDHRQDALNYLAGGKIQVVNGKRD